MPPSRPPSLSPSTSDDDTDVPEQVMTRCSPPPRTSKTPREKAQGQTPPKPSLSHTRSARCARMQQRAQAAAPIRNWRRAPRAWVHSAAPWTRAAARDDSSASTASHLVYECALFPAYAETFGFPSLDIASAQSTVSPA
ncbi:hypothetical protein DFH09DRAFT_1353916 [Mycena vulgaris]|nr:hypothetical protein DFH09DRAFT_1353916 [Mycena vulgaris]